MSFVRCFRSLFCCTKRSIEDISNKDTSNKDTSNKDIDSKDIYSKKKSYKINSKLKYKNININANSSDTKYLENILYIDTTPFIPPIVYCKVIKVYDGDTITVASRLPFEGSPIYRFSVRLAGIDSPEMRGGSELETKKAIESRDALYHLIFGNIIELRNNGKEKYGRLLADIYYKGLHINKWMLDNNYAIEYYGGKKNVFGV